MSGESKGSLISQFVQKKKKKHNSQEQQQHTNHTYQRTCKEEALSQGHK